MPFCTAVDFRPRRTPPIADHQHFIGDLSPMRRQAVHEQRIGFGKDINWR
jgi:hypothetical protein